jgi:hypothetical protein
MFDMISLAALVATFDLKLEFNPNINCLHLANISLVEFGTLGSETFGLAWLLRLLSNFGASNELQQLELKVLINRYEFWEMGPDSSWGQVDCILADKFPKLQDLNIQLLASVEEHAADNNFEEGAEEAAIAQYMLIEHPMLLKRGVSVFVHCIFDVSI